MENNEKEMVPLKCKNTAKDILFEMSYMGGFYPKTKTELLVAIIFYWQELYLGNNKITNLNRESFVSMTSLSIFGIRDNKINR